MSFNTYRFKYSIYIWVVYILYRFKCSCSCVWVWTKWQTTLFVYVKCGSVVDFGLPETRREVFLKTSLDSLDLCVCQGVCVCLYVYIFSWYILHSMSGSRWYSCNLLRSPLEAANTGVAIGAELAGLVATVAAARHTDAWPAAVWRRGNIQINNVRFQLTQHLLQILTERGTVLRPGNKCCPWHGAPRASLYVHCTWDKSCPARCPRWSYSPQSHWASLEVVVQAAPSDNGALRWAVHWRKQQARHWVVRAAPCMPAVGLKVYYTPCQAIRHTILKK